MTIFFDDVTGRGPLMDHDYTERALKVQVLSVT